MQCLQMRCKFKRNCCRVNKAYASAGYHIATAVSPVSSLHFYWNSVSGVSVNSLSLCLISTATIFHELGKRVANSEMYC